MSKDFKTPAAAGAARFITVPVRDETTWGGGTFTVPVTTETRGGGTLKITVTDPEVTDGGKRVTAPPEREESPPHEPPQYYRLNLKLDGELREYLADEAWRNRISITALVNQILTEYRDAHAAQE